MTKAVDQIIVSLAQRSSRRGFLSIAGKAALAVGAALLIGVESADAVTCPFCCLVTPTCVSRFGLCDCPQGDDSSTLNCCTHNGFLWGYVSCTFNGEFDCYGCPGGCHTLQTQAGP